MIVATNQHISIDEEICFGKPRVTGTRISVWQIYQMHEEQGRTADELIEGFPSLKKADIYAALAYFYDHREEIEAQAAETDKLVEEYLAEHGPGKFQEKFAISMKPNDPLPC